MVIRADRVFNGSTLRPEPALCIRVRDDRIVSVEPWRGEASRINGEGGMQLDARKLIVMPGVMPGLIDAHFHPVSSDFDVGRIDREHPSFRALGARQPLEAALRRGFTTVRDASGGNIDLVRAIEQGLIDGPRLLIAGRAISQTGGHGDMRSVDAMPMCSCGYCGALSTVVDGADQVRLAGREQLLRGANHVKLFLSSGVLSPTDPISMNQFTDDEARAAMEEATTRRTYVMAHAHTAEAVRRCVRNGVRSTEHGTLMDRASVDQVAVADAFVVPTLAIVDALRETPLGLPPAALEKLATIGDQNAASLDLCVQAGVKLGFGTDLFGPVRDRQCAEFAARARVQRAIDVLRSATPVNAELLNLGEQIGTIGSGACADLIAVDGNPLEDLRCMSDPERHLKLIIRGGRVVLNRLGGARS